MDNPVSVTRRAFLQATALGGMEMRALYFPFILGHNDLSGIVKNRKYGACPGFPVIGCLPRYHTRGDTLMLHGVLSLVCVMLWVIPGAKSKNIEMKEPPFPPEFTRLLGFVDDGGVEKLEILHVPRDVETPIRITVDAFRHRANYKITVSMFGATGACKSLSNALRGATVASDGPKYDVRWAIVFFDRYGAERGTIYLDQLGREGQLGSFIFKPSPHLLPWVSALVKHAFE